MQVRQVTPHPRVHRRARQAVVVAAVPRVASALQVVVAAADPGVVVAAAAPGVVVVAPDPGVVVAAADPGVVVAAPDPGVVVAAPDPGVVVVAADPGVASAPQASAAQHAPIPRGQGGSLAATAATVSITRGRG